MSTNIESFQQEDRVFPPPSEFAAKAHIKSMAELEARLRERNSNSPGDIARRLSRAKEEIAAWRQYDYLIINRDVKDAVDQLATIIQAERCRTSRLTLRFPDMEVPA